jgi:hypothetical protein
MADAQSAAPTATDEKPFPSLKALPKLAIDQIGSGSHQPPEAESVKGADELDITGHVELIKAEPRVSASAEYAQVLDSDAVVTDDDQEGSEMTMNQMYNLNPRYTDMTTFILILFYILPDPYVLITKPITVTMRQTQSRTSPTKTW